MKYFTGKLLASVGISSLFIILVSLFWLRSIYLKPGPFESPKVVVIPKGSSVAQIAELLESKGAISNKYFFVISIRLWGNDALLKAGEFLLPAKASFYDVQKILKDGSSLFRKFTIPEGLTTFEIVEKIQNIAELSGEVSINLEEGELLPETYHFAYGVSRNKIVKRMQEEMRATLNRLWDGRKRGLPFETPIQALILASIVEKETGQPSERGRVAAVFINRLRKNMRLQSDPTVVYGLTQGMGRLGRSLTRGDLKTPTPYNTYLIGGLPPGPICNPGQAAIEAVLQPPDTKEFYFVSNGAGGHEFSKSLKEHNRNVARYRKKRIKNK